MHQVLEGGDIGQLEILAKDPDYFNPDPFQVWPCAPLLYLIKPYLSHPTQESRYCVSDPDPSRPLAHVHSSYLFQTEQTFSVKQTLSGGIFSPNDNLISAVLMYVC